MFVKLMSLENKPDADNDKPYRLIEGRAIQFSRGDKSPDAQPECRGPHVVIDGDVYALEGNSYVLNNAGKTIDTYWNREARCPDAPVGAPIR